MSSGKCSVAAIACNLFSLLTLSEKINLSFAALISSYWHARLKTLP